jgi:prolyl-tRNA synthetase
MGEDTIYVSEAKKIAVNKEIYTDENLLKIGLNKDELVERKGVEVGNIFPLETKYTEALDVRFQDADGVEQPIIMGCYGIGISRLVGVIAEHFSDDKGIIWPEAVAPFKVHLVILGESETARSEAENLYSELTLKGVHVLFDDRAGLSIGEKLNDADLLGMPYRVVVSEKSLEKGGVEVKKRNEKESQVMSSAECIDSF